MQTLNRRSALGAAVLALAAWSAATSAQATVVYSGVVNLAIPNTTAGLYVNVLNGTSFSGPGTFPVLGGPGANYDFNVFGSTAWTFFSPTSSGQSAPTVPVTSRGYVSSTTTGPASSLALNTLIDGSSIFNTGSPSGSAVSTGAPVLVGFRFRNEGADLASAADDTVHFGWARFILTAGTPGTLVDYAFESTPLAGIFAGATAPIPEPATWLLMGLGVAGLVARQRRLAA
jgi:PEP-CTERM motif